MNSTLKSIYRDSVSSAAARNVIVVVLWLSINYVNSLLVHTFRKHQIFNSNPRYILFIHLVINDIIQLTTTMFLFVLSYIFYKIHTSLCCLIITFAVLTTLNTPVNLALMAVECYIAVCFPLRHAKLCTAKRTYVLISCVWVVNAASHLPDIFILLTNEPLRLFFSSILCEHSILFTHPVTTLKTEICSILSLSFVWVTLFFTYFKIFFTARAANAIDGNGRKATNTILLHGFQMLLSMLTYVSAFAQKSLLSVFPEHFIQITFILFIFAQILPRFISPIVYGLRDKTFRLYLKRYLPCTVRAGNKLHP